MEKPERERQAPPGPVPEEPPSPGRVPDDEPWPGRPDPGEHETYTDKPEDEREEEAK
jgi:hypothetical protein